MALYLARNSPGRPRPRPLSATDTWAGWGVGAPIQFPQLSFASISKVYRFTSPKLPQTKFSPVHLRHISASYRVHPVFSRAVTSGEADGQHMI